MACHNKGKEGCGRSKSEVGGLGGRELRLGSSRGPGERGPNRGLKRAGDVSPAALWGENTAGSKGRGGGVPAGSGTSREVGPRGRSKGERVVDEAAGKVRRGPVRPVLGRWCLLSDPGATGGFRVEEGHDLTWASGGPCGPWLRTGDQLRGCWDKPGEEDWPNPEWQRSVWDSEYIFEAGSNSTPACCVPAPRTMSGTGRCSGSRCGMNQLGTWRSLPGDAA